MLADSSEVSVDAGVICISSAPPHTCRTECATCCPRTRYGKLGLVVLAPKGFVEQRCDDSTQWVPLLSPALRIGPAKRLALQNHSQEDLGPAAVASHKQA